VSPLPSNLNPDTATVSQLSAAVEGLTLPELQAFLVSLRARSGVNFVPVVTALGAPGGATLPVSQQATFAAGNGPQLASRSEWLQCIRSGLAYSGKNSVAAGAGTWADIALYNPVNSGKSLLVHAARVSATVVGFGLWGVANVGVVAGGAAGIPRLVGAPAAVGLLSAVNNDGNPAKNVAAGAGDVAFDVVNKHYDLGGLEGWLAEVAPGCCFAMGPSAVTVGCAGFIEWAEVPAAYL
jgi:hypothetical protein